MKTVKECSDLIDNILTANIETLVGIGELENVRDYVIQKTYSKYPENKIFMTNIFEKINLIIEKFYEDKTKDVCMECEVLRKHILIWLDAVVLLVCYISYHLP